ncbi:hypothetical protein QJS10_CPB22g00164 [Acorus calamus]|uniref:Sulfotransferase n=1 Tax=Acorus calamus TaxID=4465 RepID=A0AAV9C2K8_ACOCL|nr:hypothetical protein QJS10_CPB22g00164 [Acorus calamus]
MFGGLASGDGVNDRSMSDELNNDGVKVISVGDGLRSARQICLGAGMERLSLNGVPVSRIERHVMHSSNPHEYVAHLEVQLYANYRIPNLDALPPPRLLATHIPYSSLPESTRDSDCRIVYISHDIKDMLVFLWHFLNEDQNGLHEPYSLEEAFESYCDGTIN